MTLLISLVFVLVFFSFHSCCDNTGMHKMKIAVSITYQLQISLAATIMLFLGRGHLAECVNGSNIRGIDVGYYFAYSKESTRLKNSIYSNGLIRFECVA